MGDYKEAYVTLATNDTYCVGALVLAQSLLETKTERDIACCITSEVSQNMRNSLDALFTTVVDLSTVVLSNDESSPSDLLKVMGITLTKLKVWTLLQYQKCVYIDADCLVLENLDDLFSREELSAAPDLGWPSCFNSGLFVYRPSLDTAKSLESTAAKYGSFDGGDQGVLNTHFNEWATADIGKKLPYVFNTVAIDMKENPAYRKCASEVKVLHFIGGVKPWHQQYSVQSGVVTPHPDNTHHVPHLERWWATHCRLTQQHRNIYLPQQLAPTR